MKKRRGMDSMQCFAKQSYLLSSLFTLHSSLFTFLWKRPFERKEKREKGKVKRIKIHPHSGWYFSFGHSPNTTGYAQVRLLLACQPCIYYVHPAQAGLNPSLPCVKGGGTACRDGGIVKSDNLHKTIPQSASRDIALKAQVGRVRLCRSSLTAPFTQGSLFMFIYGLSILLTSTAFVDKNAKYGISFSRYTVFLKTVL